MLAQTTQQHPFVAPSGEALEERLRRAGIIQGATAASDVIARFKSDAVERDAQSFSDLMRVLVR